MRNAALGDELRRRYPWLAHRELGPGNVEAGECDGCGAEARLVMTCGPGAGVYLGRRCAAEAGTSGWCEGHVCEAQGALAWLAGLPPEADAVARLWWVATGEVRLDPQLVTRLRQEALPSPPEVP